MGVEGNWTFVGVPEMAVFLGFSFVPLSYSRKDSSKLLAEV